MHRAAVARAVPRAQRVADRTGSGLSTPVLVRDDGTVLADSTTILRWVDATYGTPETTLCASTWCDGGGRCREPIAEGAVCVFDRDRCDVGLVCTEDAPFCAKTDALQCLAPPSSL